MTDELRKEHNMGDYIPRDDDLDGQITKVIKDLKDAYREAKRLRFVNNPTAYALYQVWKKYDRKEHK